MRTGSARLWPRSGRCCSCGAWRAPRGRSCSSFRRGAGKWRSRRRSADSWSSCSAAGLPYCSRNSARSSRMNVTKAAKCSVWLTFAGVMAIGCSPLSTLGFIFHDDPKVAAKYPLHPKDATDKEKNKEATVLILCDQRDGLPRELAGAYIELADNMNRQLPEMTKANKEKIKMVEEKALANYQKR